MKKPLSIDLNENLALLSASSQNTPIPHELIKYIKSITSFDEITCKIITQILRITAPTPPFDPKFISKYFYKLTEFPGYVSVPIFDTIVVFRIVLLLDLDSFIRFLNKVSFSYSFGNIRKMKDQLKKNEIVRLIKTCKDNEKNEDKDSPIEPYKVEYVLEENREQLNVALEYIHRMIDIYADEGEKGNLFMKTVFSIIPKIKNKFFSYAIQRKSFIEILESLDTESEFVRGFTELKQELRVKIFPRYVKNKVLQKKYLVALFEKSENKRKESLKCNNILSNQSINENFLECTIFQRYVELYKTEPIRLFLVHERKCCNECMEIIDEFALDSDSHVRARAFEFLPFGGANVLDISKEVRSVIFNRILTFLEDKKNKKKYIPKNNNENSFFENNYDEIVLGLFKGLLTKASDEYFDVLNQINPNFSFLYKNRKETGIKTFLILRKKKYVEINKNSKTNESFSIEKQKIDETLKIEETGTLKRIKSESDNEKLNNFKLEEESLHSKKDDNESKNCINKILKIKEADKEVEDQKIISNNMNKHKEFNFSEIYNCESKKNSDKKNTFEVIEVEFFYTLKTEKEKLFFMKYFINNELNGLKLTELIKENTYLAFLYLKNKEKISDFQKHEILVKAENINNIKHYRRIIDHFSVFIQNNYFFNIEKLNNEKNFYFYSVLDDVDNNFIEKIAETKNPEFYVIYFLAKHTKKNEFAFKAVNEYLTEKKIDSLELIDILIASRNRKIMGNFVDSLLKIDLNTKITKLFKGKMSSTALIIYFLIGGIVTTQSENFFIETIMVIVRGYKKALTNEIIAKIKKLYKIFVDRLDKEKTNKIFSIVTKMRSMSNEQNIDYKFLKKKDIKNNKKDASINIKSDQSYEDSVNTTDYDINDENKDIKNKTKIELCIAENYKIDQSCIPIADKIMYTICDIIKCFLKGSNEIEIENEFNFLHHINPVFRESILNEDFSNGFY